MNFIDRSLFWLTNRLTFVNNFRRNYFWGQQGPVWIDCNQPYLAYEMIPQLKAVVDRKASMFSNMELILKDKKTDKIIDDPDFNKLIKNPNCMMSGNKFIKQFKQQEQIYGNQFMYKNKPSKLSKYPVALWNISPAIIQPVQTGKIWDQIEMNQIISKYQGIYQGIYKDFATDDILYSRLNDIDDPIAGKSPVYALKFPLTNTKLAYEYRNIIMGKRGAVGMLTNETKDGSGSVPLTPEEKRKIHDDYEQNYGIEDGKMRVMLTEASLKWTPMSYPTKDLMLFEEVDANMLTIIDTFGMNVNIFSNKNATFENVRQSMIQVYQDTIIPESEEFTQAFGKFIGIPDSIALIASYEHLSILKEKKVDEVDAMYRIVEAISQAVTAGLLNPQQGQTIIQNELNNIGA